MMISPEALEVSLTNMIIFSLYSFYSATSPIIGMVDVQLDHCTPAYRII
ncbi:hypothetical protein [Propionivibrio sp.]|nr:hypothetical protein [Propionivibrio sp.]MBK7357290.1 hypothetical protein [Propionivibrio sp.]MBK8401317.1 hypothetical protein [Propionivibrio sp.]MBK8746017.1 hypothetical protein [Propionivibrio sp.]MBK8892539.1 hypothetical protein [Propionivibrio sp.]MBL0208666.1 hypothetical protein [Propionivibrio sp.]